ncbi:ABC transporter permease [Nitrospirillum sp. BR 11752]|uniref:ABC transporter permease n=1 Tax=Nitrospirillum sp. BR 11752 TaxID=3104293 RepID=UPI002EA6F290|nr:ABC transporter permease [Nitrospirillum sp. BR 11752]
MIRHILLVATREFRQITGTRGFWITLLILPIMLAAGPVIQSIMSRDEIERVMIIDRGDGGVEAAIRDTFEQEQQRATLVQLGRYVERHHLESADPQAPWAAHGRWYTDQDVRQFRANGGLSAALARIQAVAPPELPAFTAPRPDYSFVAAPASVTATPDAGLDTALHPLLHPDSTSGGAPGGQDGAINYVVLIPADFGTASQVRLWANGQPHGGFVDRLQQVLTRDLRTRFLVTHGTTAEVADAAATITPIVTITAPPPGGGAREAMLVRSILPLVAAYMLMMSLMLSGSWMLQSTVEERSSKLIEAVLSCVTPHELMYGKLAGTIAVGLAMIAVWIGCAFVAAYATHGVIADMIRPALAPLSSPGAVAVIVYFLVMGYIAVSVVFLAIGGISESMRDAQAYLTPVMLIILMPVIALIQGILAGGGGIGIEILTWVPIWTPFAVLARLGLGMPTWEVLGAGATLALFAVVEVMLLGRLFQASILAAGSRPNLATIIARMRRS